jgi:pimeloyl-ACP methyl ester carboxylesterase
MRASALRSRAVAVTAGIAAAAVTSAALIAWRTRRAEAQNPALGGIVEVDGVRLHYVDRGSGPAVVLLHGNGSLIEEVAASGVLELAARKYRVIAFDRPGYGHSDRPRSRIWGPRAQARLLLRALREIGVEQPVVLGHSWGTLVALWMALEAPRTVRGLVLASGYYFPSPRLDVPLLSAPAVPVLGDILRWTLSPWIGRLAWPLILKRIFGPAHVPERFRREVPLWMILRPAQLRAAAAESAMMIPAAARLRLRYRDLAVPTEVLAGQGDRHVSAEQSQWLAEALPDAELHLTPEAGHMLLHHAPEDVVAALDRVAARAGPRERTTWSRAAASTPLTEVAPSGAQT